MLNFLRKKTKIIIWTVLVSFVAWGGYAVSTQFVGASRSPGRIFGKEVSFQDHLVASQAVQFFVPPSEADEPYDPSLTEARTWEFLILAEEAKRRRMNVSDEELRTEIRNILSPLFPAGMTQKQYEDWVRGRIHQESRTFEKVVREHLRIRKLLDLVRDELPDRSEEKLKQWLTELFERARLTVY